MELFDGSNSVQGGEAIQIVPSLEIGRVEQQAEPPEPNLVPQRSIEMANLNYFRIMYGNPDGLVRTFEFTLLPAIENNLRYNSTSRLSAGGGATVPEVKPGLLKRTIMNVKRFNVPGGPPAVQVLGIEQTLWQLVGALVGNELQTLLRGEKAEQLYPALFRDGGQLDAVGVEEFFNSEVVQSGRSVEVMLYSNSPSGDRPLHIVFRAVLQSVRYFAVRQDRVYYAFDFLVTEYPRAITHSPDDY